MSDDILAELRDHIRDIDEREDGAGMWLLVGPLMEAAIAEIERLQKRCRDAVRDAADTRYVLQSLSESEAEAMRAPGARDRASLADELVLQERECHAMLADAGIPRHLPVGNDAGALTSHVRRAVTEIERLRSDATDLLARHVTSATT